MGEPIFGVVPNFSEGRRADVMDAICDALQVPGAHLVYRQADADHNRLDTTVLGSRDGVHRAAVSAARVAAGLIDMEHHRGGHPRMGATDVIPFMPVRDVEMVSCVELAREVGAELAQAFDLPVYLYDQAALIPERASLADRPQGRVRGLARRRREGGAASRPRPACDRFGGRHRGGRPCTARRVQRVSGGR